MISSITLHLFEIKYIRLVILETLLEILKLIIEIIFSGTTFYFEISGIDGPRNSCTLVSDKGLHYLLPKFLRRKIKFSSLFLALC